MRHPALRLAALALAAVVVALDLWGGAVAALGVPPLLASALGVPIGGGVAWAMLRSPLAGSVRQRAEGEGERRDDSSL